MWRPDSNDKLKSVWWVTAATPAQLAGDSNNFVRIPKAKWRSNVKRPAAPTDRFVDGLCGGCVQECDLRTTAGLQAARAAITARLPIILRHAAKVITPETCSELGSVASLAKLLRGQDVTVLKAPRQARSRFTYYHDLPDETVARVAAVSDERERRRHQQLIQPPPANARIIMKWEAFARQLKCEMAADVPLPAETHYMQLAMAVRGGTIKAGHQSPMTTRVSERILKQLLIAMERGPLAQLTSSFGPWTVSNLYCGPAGTLAPCHWDAMDNVFMQLHGRKDVLVFSPETPGMRPFPYDHPYASRSQVDLEKPDAAARAELQSEGAIASLGPGDGLFLPSHWWHHIHSCATNEVSISLNFWFDPSREMHAVMHSQGRLPSPLPRAVHANISRELEAFAVTIAPTFAERARLFQGLLAMLEGDDPNDREVNGKALLEPCVLAVRNYLAVALVRTYGEQGAAEYCRAYLDPRRWSEVQSRAFLDSG
jgi:hypothetical protein